jgi:hypothetical protein
MCLCKESHQKLLNCKRKERMVSLRRRNRNTKQIQNAILTLSSREQWADIRKISLNFENKIVCFAEEKVKTERSTNSLYLPSSFPWPKKFNELDIGKHQEGVKQVDRPCRRRRAGCLFRFAQPWTRLPYESKYASQRSLRRTTLYSWGPAAVQS